MRLSFFIIVLLLTCKLGNSQAVNLRKHSISFQPTFGAYQTKIFGWDRSLPGTPDANFKGIEAGLLSSIKWNIEGVNVGFGIGLRNKFTEYEGLNTVTPSLFGTVELVKKNQFHLVTVLIDCGIIQGTIEDKYKLFISLGPKFNTGGAYKKFNFSIHPSVLIQQIETKTLIHRYIGSTSSNQEYVGYLRTIIGNIAFIIEFNKLGNPSIPNEN